MLCCALHKKVRPARGMGDRGPKWHHPDAVAEALLGGERLWTDERPSVIYERDECPRC